MQPVRPKRIFQIPNAVMIDNTAVLTKAQSLVLFILLRILWKCSHLKLDFNNCKLHCAYITRPRLLVGCLAKATALPFSYYCINSFFNVKS